MYTNVTLTRLWERPIVLEQHMAFQTHTNGQLQSVVNITNRPHSEQISRHRYIKIYVMLLDFCFRFEIMLIPFHFLHPRQTRRMEAEIAI